MILVRHGWKFCARCGHCLPLTKKNFSKFPGRRDTRRWDSYCRACRCLYAAEVRDRRRSTPEGLALDRERRRVEAARRRARVGPRLTQQQWRKLVADPQRHQAHNENRRIDDKLRQERRGAVLEPVAREKWVGLGRALYLTPEPLVSFVTQHGGPAVAARGSDTLQRALRRLLDGETLHAELSVADALCVKHNLLLHDLYPPERYPEIYA